ncbi:glycosyltransferase family 2 protein [Lentzea sp. NPDC051213]|uniref:glycosyltransferase family 2 protein n=1 Tax=Lentzea sp. NPDC051213 TaxID=3364126 RepID=UPI0037906C20
MPVISVVTPVHAGRAEVLLEAGESLRKQQLPTGWTLEWLVQEDSATPELAEAVSAFPFASYQANGAHLGIALSRNHALVRSTGELVHVLDSDDVLLPHALAVAIEAFGSHPEIHWVATQADDLLSGGTRRSFPPLIEPGPIAAGAVSAYYLATADAGTGVGSMPFHPNCTTLRAATVHALGGWAGLYRLEDISLLAALTELAPGYFTPEVCFLRRKHSDSTSAKEDWAQLLPESHAAVQKRVEAIRAGALSF